MLLLLQDGARKSQTPSTLSTKNTTMTVPQLRASRIAIVSNPFSAVGRERTKFFMRHLVCSRTYMYMYVCVYEDDTSKNIASGESRTHGARMRVRVPQFLSVRTESKSFERSLSGKKKKKLALPSHHKQIGYTTSAFSEKKKSLA